MHGRARLDRDKIAPVAAELLQEGQREARCLGSMGERQQSQEQQRGPSSGPSSPSRPLLGTAWGSRKPHPESPRGGFLHLGDVGSSDHQFSSYSGTCRIRLSSVFKGHCEPRDRSTSPSTCCSPLFVVKCCSAQSCSCTRGAHLSLRCRTWPWQRCRAHSQLPGLRHCSSPARGPGTPGARRAARCTGAPGAKAPATSTGSGD